MYEAILFEKPVRWMFLKLAKSSGKTNSDFMVELLELKRSSKRLSSA